jgi:hypothetical protein
MPGQYTEQLMLRQKLAKFHRTKARESRLCMRNCRRDIKLLSQLIQTIRDNMNSTKDLKFFLSLKKRLPSFWDDMQTMRRDFQESKEDLKKHEENAACMDMTVYKFVIDWKAKFIKEISGSR